MKGERYVQQNINNEDHKKRIGSRDQYIKNQRCNGHQIGVESRRSRSVENRSSVHRKKWISRSYRGAVMISFRQFIEAVDHKDQVAQARQKVIDAQQAQQRVLQAVAAKKRFSDDMTRIKGQGKPNGSNLEQDY